MSPQYPIMDVHADWKTEPEQMGSKQKFWLRPPNDPDGREWLFKFPTKNTGEHWAEKMAYEMPVRCVSSLRRSDWHSIERRMPNSAVAQLHGDFLLNTNYITAPKFSPALILTIRPSRNLNRESIRSSVFSLA